MAENAAKLRLRARRLKIKGYETMTAAQLEKAINAHGSNGASRTVTKKKGANVSKRRGTATTTKRGTGTRSTSRTKATAQRASKAPARGRPAKSAPARGAKRQATARTTARKSNTNGDVGRAAISERLNWRASGYSPREGSVAETIFETLKRNKGDRDQSFKDLKKRLKSLFPGDSQEDALRKLKYRIARITFDFAVATGQHAVATNRVQYGTGPTAQASAKAKRSAARSTGAKRTTTARGSKATGTRRTAQKGSTARKSTPARGKAQTGSRGRTTGRKAASSRKR